MGEKKFCQSCKEPFEIAPDDFVFYRKMQVPPPTWCPDCRIKRRLAYYVDILKPRMYARKCDATGKNLISMYPPNTDFPVYERSYWFTDKWDPMDYGREYDFTKPFFIQFRELQRDVPRFHSYNNRSTNCEYSKALTNSSDCYLSTGWENQDCFYTSSMNCKECVDCWFMGDCELSYSCINCESCYNVLYSQYAYECTDSAFLYDCKNCVNCFGCVNLRNKSYYIFNKPYTKANYEKEIKKYNLKEREVVEKVKEKFESLKLQYPRVFAFTSNTEDSTGDNIADSNHSQYCFDVWGINNCKYASLSANMSDSYDCYDAGSESSLMYEASGSGDNLHNLAFVYFVGSGSYDSRYLDLCTNVHHCFGCVGISKKSYCIFNKQYTKQEYEKLLPKIIEHMNKMPYQDVLGRTFRFGEYFPPELSPFSYQNTSAQDFYPLVKEKAKEKGYFWEDYEASHPKITKKASDLPKNITEARDDVTHEVVEDALGHPYKIIQQELELYRKMGVPLPDICPVCRFGKRVAQRNPLQLWTRQCECGGATSARGHYKNTATHVHGKKRCSNIFQTSFTNERPEIVYCKWCFEEELIS